MKKTATLVLACSALALGACSSDDDGVTIAPTEPTTASYMVSFTNLSTGQPMTPTVVAVHDDAVNLYSVGVAASTQLQEIAENGNNDPMVELAGSLGEQVSASGVAGDGPLGPGQTSTITLAEASTSHVLSTVNMVVCTNDGFTGVDSVALPTGTDPVTYEAVPYDAGTEENILDVDYWVPPCGGEGNLHNDELNAVVSAHPGQAGTGATDFVGTDAILRIEVTRL